MSRTHYLCGAAWAGLLAVLSFSGCASGQMNRIDSNRDLYETWPLETKQAVLDGKVEPGMNPDMVTVAWGKPSEVVTNGAGDEVWVYKTGGEDPSMMNTGMYPSAANPGGGYPYPYPSGGMGGSGIGMGGGNVIGVSTGRGGTGIISGSSIGMGGTIGGGGMGGPMRRPNPVEVREVVFRGGVVLRADEPPDPKEK